MRSSKLHVVLVISLLIIAISVASAYKVAQDADNLIEQPLYNEDQYELDDEYRMKRQLENFDEEFPTASTQEQQEEPGFWDRVVKVALKLFNRFVEWLNS